METQRFEHLYDNSAVTMHDWFWQSGGPRREQDPKRVIKGNLLKFEALRADTGGWSSKLSQDRQLWETALV